MRLLSYIMKFFLAGLSEKSRARLLRYVSVDERVSSPTFLQRRFKATRSMYLRVTAKVLGLLGKKKGI